MNDSSSSPDSGPERDPVPSADEIEALRAENAALRARIGDVPEDEGPSGFRKFSAWFLAIVAIILISTAMLTGWAKSTILDTDTFVATLSPLSKNPAVAEALAARIGDATVEATNLETAIAAQLPPELTLIAAPVADAAGSLVATAAEEVIQTDAFAAVWSTVLRTAHRSVLLLVQGNGAVVAEGGTVAIDLDQLAEPAIAAVADRGFDLTAVAGEDYTLGEVVLIESDALGSAQSAVAFLDMLGWLTLLLARAAVGLALLVAPDRRRQIAILGFGTAIAGILNLVSLRLGRGLTVGSIPGELDRSAALATWDTLLRSLRSSLWALVLIGLVIGLAAWFFGPGSKATRVRESVGDGIDRRRGRDTGSPSALSLFFASWRHPLEWGVVGLAMLVLLLMQTVTFGAALIVVLIAAVLIAAVEVIAGPRSAPQDPAAMKDVPVSVGTAGSDD
jgi:predicted regulator of Ras-like GTPase activity (Roadblock/LC7/MglB family)